MTALRVTQEFYGFIHTEIRDVNRKIRNERQIAFLTKNKHPFFRWTIQSNASEGQRVTCEY